MALQQSHVNRAAAGAVNERSAAAPSEFRRRGGILWSLLGVLVILGLAPLGTGLWRMIHINREALTTSMQEFQLLLASSTAEKVDLKIEGVQGELLRTSQLVGFRADRPSKQARGEALLTMAQALDDRVRYLRHDPLESKSVPLAIGHLPQELQEAFDQGVESARMLIVGAIDSEVVISPPMPFGEDERESAMLMIVPVVSPTGAYRGILSALVDLRSIWDTVTESNSGGNVVYAMDNTGRVFASTDESRVRLGYDWKLTALVRRFMSGDGRASETMPFSVMRDATETRFLGSYHPTLQGWGIFVQAELARIYTPVRWVVGSTAKWTLLTLGVAALGAAFFATTLSRPIKRLAVASRAFARGEHETRVPVRSRNEIGELAHTFNVMANEIETHIADLKQAADENQEMFEGTIVALANAIDAKDPYTRGHSVRVNRFSVAVARRLDLDQKTIREIHVAALLHDIGKIGIDDAILKKPGTLTAEEYEIIKTHAALGASIMAPIPKMQAILPGLRWHHERNDGSGYPDGLVKPQIPMIARVIAVADTFDAVTSERSYQSTRTYPAGLELLKTLTGALDPDVVDAFERAYRDGEILPDDEDSKTVLTMPEADPSGGGADSPPLPAGSLSTCS